MRFDFHQYDFVENENSLERLAVIDHKRSVTWSQFFTEVQDWVVNARKLGVHKDIPIVITGHKEIEFLVAIVGSLILGAPFVPVDSINPSERILRIRSLVNAVISFDATKREFTNIDEHPQEMKEKDLAYIMFTSGSTGDPKGVQIGRESLGLFSDWICQSLALGNTPVFMDQMLFSFDFSLFNWVGALASGGTCVLCSRDVIAKRESFNAYLKNSKINIWASTPSFVRQQLLDPEFNSEYLPDLRVFVFGAESLTSSVAEALWGRFPHARIINSYGPTEATCSTTWVEIDSELRKKAPLPFPIGRAKPYADIFIEDGEICVAGDHVMRGYLNREDLNSSRMFIRNGKRGYRTGDLGVMDSEGLVTFKGRRDDQIKLHGYRIELAEVDAAMATLPGVRAGCAVALRRSDGTLVRMLGFVDLAQEGPAGIHSLPTSLLEWKEHLGKRLPPYMIPSELLACYGFPLSQTEKADRKQLERMYVESRMRSKHTT